MRCDDANTRTHIYDEDDDDDDGDDDDNNVQQSTHNFIL